MDVVREIAYGLAARTPAERSGVAPAEDPVLEVRERSAGGAGAIDGLHNVTSNC